MRPRRRVLALALLALFTGACSSKMSAAPEAPGYGGGADGMAMPASYDAEESYAEADYAKSEREMIAPAEPAPAPSMAPPSPARSPSGGAAGGLAGGSGSRSVGKDQPTGEAKPDTGTTSTKEPEKPVARQIIYTAEMHLAVFKREEAMKQVEAVTLAVGGYIQTMSEGYYVVRIPAARLREVMSEVGNLGMVTHRSLQAQDVTEQYVDLQTRIRVLRETQAQLIELLKKAHNVEETLRVRQALDQVTMELEQALGRLRMLESLIGFSTLTIRIEERGPQNAVPSSNDPFPWVDSLGVEATEWK